MAIESSVSEQAESRKPESTGAKREALRLPGVFRAVQVAVVVLFGFSVWRLAWISDDSLITMRTALNADAGMGLVYNVGERVEAYTHPLWFFIMWASGAISGSWIYSILAISIVLSTAAAAVLIFQVRDWWRLSIVSAALLISNSLLVWSTSGLEGPLAMILFAAFFVTFRVDAGLLRLATLGVLSAAMILTRMDYVLLLAPGLVWIAWLNRRQIKRLAILCVATILPLAVWFGFSLYYYSFLFPATLTAKTNTTIPKSEIVAQGLTYLRVSSLYDLVAPIVFIVAIVLVVARGSVRTRVVLTGVSLYLIYVVWVGGDFMVARFLAIPVFACLFIIAEPAPQPDPERREAETTRLLGPGLALAACAIVLLGWGNTLFRQDGVTEYSATNSGIADERAFWSRYGAALDPLVDRTVKPEIPMELNLLEQRAQAWRKVRPEPPQDAFVTCGSLGNAGFTLGPANHLIDTCGLTDRFVAMLPYSPTGPWRIGHFERKLPDGYQEAVRWSNPNLVVDPELRQRLIQLWEQIR